ncbi:conserved hypothetical protein [Ricinus communis]|uniref:Uncharacterized protein n=1 Tax=Ricinus communis TaxID=3988 RepID=B9T621_RICCO|nr:conserved hypothetical protein [Ricinus communis]
MRSAEVDSAVMAVVACIVDGVKPPSWETFKICISYAKDTEGPYAEGPTAGVVVVAVTSSNISILLDPAERVAATAEADYCLRRSAYFFLA